MQTLKTGALSLLVAIVALIVPYLYLTFIAPLSTIRINDNFHNGNPTDLVYLVTFVINIAAALLLYALAIKALKKIVAIGWSSYIVFALAFTVYAFLNLFFFKLASPVFLLKFGHGAQVTLMINYPDARTATRFSRGADAIYCPTRSALERDETLTVDPLCEVWRLSYQ